MAKFSNEIVQFCAGNENTSKFLTRFQDYYAHTLAVNGTKNMAYDTSLSLDEKASKVSEAFFAEVESRSGVQRNALNKDSWMAHPNVQWVN